MDWDARKSQLVIDTYSVGKKSRVTKRLIQVLEVGDALYFLDRASTDTIARSGNAVELLTLGKNSVSFLIKRRYPGGSFTTILRSEVRKLEISARTLKFIERYYHNQILTGSSTWVLKR